MKLVVATLWLFMVYLIDDCHAAEAKPTPPQGSTRPAMRDVPTHDDLVRKAQRAANLVDPMQHLAKAEGGDPSKVNRPDDLLAQSDILCYNGLATLVPKRAILASPAAHQERLAFKPGSKIVSWGDFYQQNRNWITTVEVSRIQAEGKQALAEETSKRIEKSRNLVVATYQGGPISVLPPPTPPPAESAKPEATPR